MLKLLKVKNLALIDELELKLHPGLNVLTGETGAGKSILINAISLAVGERADIEQIRTGADAAIVEATFDLSGREAIQQTLKELCGSEQDELVICRVLERIGRTRCFINGHPVSLKALKRVGELLVDIHGQHEHQSLLHPETHLAYLDRYGGERLKELLEEYRSLYDALKEVEGLRRKIMSSERDRERRIDLLRYQIREIDAAKLVTGEEEELRSERHRLLHSEKLIEAVERVRRCLHGDEEAEGAVPLLMSALAELRKASQWDDGLNEHSGQIEQLLYSLEDVTKCIDEYASKLEFNPQRLEEIEGRLALISALKRKYGDSVEEVLAYRQRIEAELNLLESHEEHLEELERKSSELRQRLAHVAGELSKVRNESAKEMERAMEEQLHSLMMDRARFKVSLVREVDENGLAVDGDKYAFDRDGIDRVEFLISPNEGEPLKPLAKIASGGEISRIMLALRAILRSAHEIPTLIFDEIDVGIGGRTAEAVGKKLKSVSRYAQVICVTHLPQIACMADAHISVRKVIHRGRTVIQVHHLSFDERVAEIARMLAGARVTETTLKQAAEMLTGQAG
ncbi:MAG: DNA repair protein RecN [Armatimonadota bacterium]|nr:DNA repair protein RecN [Armatimonadota bacterium]MCX7776859.1 DNA repair protein RecN [Armatimonadota bacterium]MDW8024455.1 DNA repair protein RecN [Armatimonadota bacterium]